MVGCVGGGGRVRGRPWLLTGRTVRIVAWTSLPSGLPAIARGIAALDIGVVVFPVVTVTLFATASPDVIVRLDQMQEAMRSTKDRPAQWFYGAPSALASQRSRKTVADVGECGYTKQNAIVHAGSWPSGEIGLCD
jgi:hypothetical protein